MLLYLESLCFFLIDVYLNLHLQNFSDFMLKKIVYQLS